jgi:putative flippase GtrA
MTDDQNPSCRTGAKHGAGFVASGGLAFLTDAVILAGLTRVAGLDPFTSRIVAIGCAVIVGFFAHRRLTFAVQTPATLAEFTKFIGVAATASLVNYAIYVGVLIARSNTEPIVALFIATLFAMGISYVGLRFGVFRNSRH